LLYYPEAYQRLQETVRGDRHCFVGEKNDYYTLFIVLLFFEFGITCVAFILSPPSSANVKLTKLGLGWISARSKHPKQDKEAQALYKKLQTKGNRCLTCGHRLK
jgi:hypothetical protein